MSSASTETTPAGTGTFPRFQPADLTTFCCAVLERLDVPPDDARTVADCLVGADLRGVDSHGVVRLPVYAKRIQAKVVKARPVIKVEPRFAAVALVHGDNGLGPVVGTRAMDEAMRLAEHSGVGYVGVRGSNHFGTASFYVQRAIARNFIGCAISNAPPNMAAFGGRERFLGTNPLAVGIPAGKDRPLIFDASSSVVARGKIIVAAHRNLPIPEGWAIDPEGRPTTDAAAALAGAVLPFGGPKGSAISFIIDIRHVFAAFRTDLFLPQDEFLTRMDEVLAMLKSSAPAAGVGCVLAPGELELDTEFMHRQQGLPLAVEVVGQLVEIGNQVGVEFPMSLTGGLDAAQGPLPDGRGSDQTQRTVL
ncbi:MAG: Ldh family oxidoreductase [Candidatus Solibacter sp.]|nr:Ldh family oxidoreductase [Candidatus Solibacter sp.]